MSLRSNYDATNMLTDRGTSRLSFLSEIFSIIESEWTFLIPLTHELHHHMAYSPPFGSSHMWYLQGLLTAHPAGVKWTSKRETLHWRHNHSWWLQSFLLTTATVILIQRYRDFYYFTTAMTVRVIDMRAEGERSSVACGWGTLTLKSIDIHQYKKRTFI